MYYKPRKRSIFAVDPHKKAFALKLARNPTPAEEFLWNKLRGRQVRNNVFVRQKIILGWIVDFYSSHSRVVIELDGSMHDPKADRTRDIAMNNVGIYVLRFKNHEVFENTEWVIARIAESLRNPDAKPLLKIKEKPRTRFEKVFRYYGLGEHQLTPAKSWIKDDLDSDDLPSVYWFVFNRN